MRIDTGSIVSITEANQNFSRVARLADETGAVLILKNNAPRYLLIEYDGTERTRTATGEDVTDVARRVIEESREAVEARAASRTKKEGGFMRNIEQKIREVDATMAMEGMPLSDSDKEDMRKVLRGEVSFAEMRKRIIGDYQPKTKRVIYERV